VKFILYLRGAQDTSEEFDLEVNLEKTKYTLMSLCKKAGQKHSKHSIKVANKSFEGAAKF
jgi:hypothetical protein